MHFKLTTISTIMITLSALSACSDNSNSETNTEDNLNQDSSLDPVSNDGTQDDNNVDADPNLDNTNYLCSNADHPSVGSMAVLNTYHHMVAGEVTIIDNCTIRVSNFTYDGEGPAVYFYGGKDGRYDAADGGFPFGMKLNGQSYTNDNFTITLDSPSWLDDMNGVSVWCADFSVSFGDGLFQ